MKGSLVIVGFFVLGILAGLSGIVPEKIVEIGRASCRERV